jgi:hypothetical protein
MKATWAQQIADNGERFMVPITDEVGNEAIRRGAIRVCEQWKAKGEGSADQAIRILQDCEFQFDIVPFDWNSPRKTRAIELVVIASEENTRILQERARALSILV